MGLAVGDTIEGTSPHHGFGERVETVRLTLLWVGERIAVWRCVRRHGTSGEWEDDGEQAHWDLAMREWHKVSDGD